jgi:hypothetical protein
MFCTVQAAMARHQREAQTRGDSMRRLLQARATMVGVGAVIPLAAGPGGATARRIRAALFACLVVVGVLLVAVFAASQQNERAAVGQAGAATALPFGASAFAPLPGATASPLSAAGRSQRVSAYGQLPLAFEPNRGQLDRRALYVARGAGYTLLLTHRSAALSLAQGRSGHSSHHAALTIGLLGASQSEPVVGERGLPGTANYMLGKDRSRWHTNVPTFGRVAYRNAWPGIGVAFYGNQGRLEYDFDVAAGADPSRIALSFGGARSLRVDTSGALVLRLPGGSVRQLTSHAYQLVGGRRQAVSSRYVVAGHSVRLRLGHYDHRLPLTIDPVVLAYSTYLGGGSDDTGQAITVDSAGSAFVTGWTTSTDFPTTAGAFDTTQNGDADAFVAKLAPDGKSLVYATYLGGSNQDIGAGIAVDSAGSAFVTGRTLGTDFPVTPGAYQTTAPGGPADGFVTKLAPDGQSLAYSTYLGGSDQDNGQGIAVDSAGSAYVTGFTDSGNFPTTAGAFHTALGGTRDDFVTKLAPDGKTLAYSTYLGGSGDEGEFRAGIAVDSAGSAYVTDKTSSTDFPTTGGAFDTTLGGSLDAFVSKLAPDGKTLAYSTYLGGSSDEDFSGGAITLDSAGSAYVTGSTTSTDFPTTGGAFQTTLAGSSNAFVTKLAPDGKTLVYSTYLGGNSDVGIGIALDSASSAYVTGDTFSSNFPTTADAFDTTLGGTSDAFVSKLAPDGKTLAYSTYLGGSGDDFAFGIAVDPAGSAYMTGVTHSTDFPTTVGALHTTLGGSSDAYVAKLGAPASTVTTTSNTPTSTVTSTSTTPPRRTPPAPTPTAKVSAVGCAARTLILTDVFPRAGKTQLLGVGPPAAVGKRVKIVSAWNGKTVATPTVQPDLSFSATAPLPPLRLRFSNKARYVAMFGSQRSLVLKFARRMYTTAITIAGRAITFTGTITRPLAKPIQPIVIRASASCSTIGQGVIVATVKPSPSGAFTAHINGPAGRSVVYLRAQTKVRNNTHSKKTFATFTLIRGLSFGG